ncbi:MAG: DUF4080 domain-containing protein [Clostridiales bacterium]|nr:DUF4080 domain-containing protein [Clostridiales bacterium]
MKLFITSLNSKYIHTNLAIRYLYQYAKEINNLETYYEDFTINQNKDLIVKKIITSEADVVAFSMYIWNYKMTLEVISNLKKIKPEMVIIVGGPEVSYNPEEILKDFFLIDYVISGEGEAPFSKLMENLMKNGEILKIPGVSYRSKGEIIIGEKSPLMDISELIFPYELPFEDNKLIYYESSRGCPYNCSYCISSTIKGVRYKSIESVKNDLQLFLDHKVRIVKFIDRTFNVDKKRSFEIMKYLIENDNGITTFHLELSPNLIDFGWIELLRGVRKDLFQFEIGIQSVHENVIKAVNRNILFDQFEFNLKQIIGLRNIHIHVDLIAGLPFEDINRFMISFDKVYDLKADHFQLGFLKLLKGSQIRREYEKYGYVFDDQPPYEILKNDFLSYNDLIYLKGIEELVELYYNSHHFDEVIDFIMQYFKSPSEFYKGFQQFWNRKNLFDNKHQLIDLFIFLFQFMESKEDVDLDLLKELMKFDYFKKNRYKELEFFGKLDLDMAKQDIHDMLKNSDFISEKMPQFKGEKAKDILKSIQIMNFEYDVFNKTYQKIKTIGYYDYKNEKFGMIKVGVQDE